MDRFDQLCQQRRELREKLEKVEAELREELGMPAATRPAPQPRRPAPARTPARQPAPQPRRTTATQQRTTPAPRPAPAPPSVEATEDTATAPVEQQDEQVVVQQEEGTQEDQQEEQEATPQNGDGRQASLKDVILNQVLANSRTGMELREIVAEITHMIQRGEYKTKAQKVTPIVSQALHQLKTEQLVNTEKSATPPHRTLYSLGETA